MAEALKERKLLSPEELERAILDIALQVHKEYPRFFRLAEGLGPGSARKYAITDARYFEYFSRKFPSMLLNVASRCPVLEVRQEILKDCYDEEVQDPDTAKLMETPPGGISHREVLYRDCEKLGISREDVDSTVPTPIISACVHALDNMTRLLPWQAAYMAAAVTELRYHPYIKAVLGDRVGVEKK